MSSRTDLDIVDVTDPTTFDRLPPCADARFDHRSCNYWEDEIRGSKSARPSWWQPSAPVATPRGRPVSDNPFAASIEEKEAFNPFASSSGSASAGDDSNPFAPARDDDPSVNRNDVPRKLRLLGRGHGVFGSYAKILQRDGEPAVYVQFGPLSAYPRAQHIRELYPRLPQSPLPAVITCVATTLAARRHGLGVVLVGDVAVDLAERGFSAVEAYPDLSLAPDETSSASPAFWERCGFHLAADDERYPVMRRELH